MNNLSKLLDDGTLKIKKINMGKPNKIKTYKKMMKQTKKKKRNRKYSPQIIIKKQSAGVSKTSDNKQKIVNRVIDEPNPPILDTIDKLVNQSESSTETKTNQNGDNVEIKTIKGTVDKDKVNQEEKQYLEKDMEKDKVNQEEKQDLEKDMKPKAESVKPKQEKKKRKKSKRKKKVKQYDTKTMIDKLKQKGILVSGKNEKLVKDIYLYALDDQIKIYRK
jgi:hypothetical protein